MNKKSLGIAALVLLLLVVVAMNLRQPAAPVEGRTFLDGAGRHVTLPGIPQRLISMAPANTEILFALGLGDRVLGVTTWCNYPAEAQAIEKVGDAWAPNYERIVALQPDLVLAAGTADSEVVVRLEALGVPVLVVNAPTVADVVEQVVLVGAATGAAQRAAELAGAMRDRIEEIEARVAPAAADRPTVFWALDDQLWTVGPGSFVHDLIELAGGRNLAEGLGAPYAQYSLEALLQADPDVIIVATLAPGAVAGLDALPGWSDLTAVKAGRVHPVDGDLVSRPGPRIVDGLELVARLLYPGQFR
ncbi:MAG TPA: cobalamin-binding protein [Bacillota bacterium]|nr:cobalamin-binding protein [Bacillota bacterium]